NGRTRDGPDMTSGNTDLGMLRVPGEVLFGTGTVSQAGLVAARFGQRVLVVTDPFLAECDVAAALLRPLHEAKLDVDVLSLAVPELPLTCVHAAIDAARDLAPDCVVAFGGGSSIDLGKLVALGCAHRDDVRSFYGENAVPGPITPLVAVPTT